MFSQSLKLNNCRIFRNISSHIYIHIGMFQIIISLKKFRCNDIFQETLTCGQADINMKIIFLRYYLKYLTKIQWRRGGKVHANRFYRKFPAIIFFFFEGARLIDFAKMLGQIGGPGVKNILYPGPPCLVMLQCL